MPIFRLDKNNITFPSAHLADESGIIAVGGDLSPERVVAAYTKGIFPWFNPEEEILWWSPNPRFVLFPEKLYISKSMKQVLNRKQFDVTFDTHFEEVIRECKQTPRKNQEGGGSWISDEMIASYTELHRRGIAHSVEVWKNGILVGGLYGIMFGKIFCGESMFTKVSNASKVGFITFVQNLAYFKFELVDCQVHTSHLESLGAEMIPRFNFLALVKRNVFKGCFDNTSLIAKFRTSFE
jgi:leucyl/phenylalanyl-tRNA--protein transferase